jgi:hypothetical protein
MDKHLAVNVYDANDNAIPASVTYQVKHNGKWKKLGPQDIQGVKDKPTSIQIPTEIDEPVIKVTATYKGTSKTVEVDTSQSHDTIIKLDYIPPPPPVPRLVNPWTGGSFYLAVFVVVVATIIAVALLVPWYAIVAVIIGAILALTIIGAFTLRGNEQLRDEPFLKLIEMSFRNLPLIKMLSRKPKD